MSSAVKVFGQYLDLCQSCQRTSSSDLIADVNAKGQEALNAAIATYRRDPMGLVGVSADEMFAPDYGVNLKRVKLPVDAAASFRCGVPKLGSLLAVVANDAFHLTDTLVRNMPQGLTVCSLNKVPAHLVPLVAEALAYGLDRGGAAAALNALLLCDGVLIHVAKDVKIDKAIQVVNISNPAMPLLSARRVVIIAEENSEVKVLLCDHSQTSDVEHINSQVIDVLAAPSASVELYDIEEGSDASRRYWQLNARQHEKSRLTINTTCLHGGRTCNEYSIDVIGDNAETSLSGLSISAGEQVVDNKVTLTHLARYGRSRQLFKNALFDNSRGGFGGKIIVAEDAVFTDATQTNRNLLAGDEARMVAAPQLEIYCDEVKCSHGATTGQLDDRALFYMQSRGISLEEARKMLTQAFMVDVIDNISFEVLRQRIHQLVEKRLSGAAASCDSCLTVCNTDNQ
ncbi:MAG: Fe-S cluster assembly protein SufD [Muribaculaceae bacterium]|nr:Fe-S cluster assembly protein SufD [Muribaculaceae bacterium]